MRIFPYHFQSLDTYNLEDQEMEIKRLEQDVQDNRPLLDSINISWSSRLYVSRDWK